MFQYTPLPMQNTAAQTATPAGKTAAPDRFINEEEYNTVMKQLDELGIEEGFVQELPPPNDDWLPDFSRANPFPRDIYTPVWP
jgi:hypothetical protein